MSNNSSGGVSLDAETIGTPVTQTLWQINILPAANQVDRLGESMASAASDAGLTGINVNAARGFLVQGRLSESDIQQIASNVFADSIVEEYFVGKPGDESLNRINSDSDELFYVLPKAGVTDPEAETAKLAIQGLGYDVSDIRTFRRFVTRKLSQEHRDRFTNLLANESIEQLVVGPIEMEQIQMGHTYDFEIRHVQLLDAERRSLDKDQQGMAIEPDAD